MYVRTMRNRSPRPHDRYRGQLRRRRTTRYTVSGLRPENELVHRSVGSVRAKPRRHYREVLSEEAVIAALYEQNARGFAALFPAREIGTHVPRSSEVSIR